MTALRAGPCTGLCAVRVLPRRLAAVAAAAAKARHPTATTAVLSRALSVCAIMPPKARSRACPPALSPSHLPPPPPPPPTSGFRRPLFTTGPSVVTHYVDLPPDYTDAKGLAFRPPRRRRRRWREAEVAAGSEADLDLGLGLDAAEVATIFGRASGGLTPAAATRLLRILHGRRVAGTLDDPAVRGATARYTAAQVAAALAHLRRAVPVDEVINAGLRAEDELAAMEEGMTEEPPEPTERPKPSVWRARLFRDPPEGNDVYGVGALDRIRAQNLAKAAERERERERARAAADEAARLAQEQAGAEQAAVAIPGDVGGGRGTAVAAPRASSPRMQKWVQAATSDLAAPPAMSAWQRLGPSYAFAVAVVGCAWGAAYALTPEGPAEGLPAPDTEVSPLTGASAAATATVLGLVAANVAVSVLWRVPPLWRVLNRYLLVVPATPRPASLLGAVFSHQRPGHLAANMAFLLFLGLRLHDEIGGRAAFLALYTSGGVLAFAASLTHLVLWPGQLHLTTLGASGALYAVATAYFVLHQTDGFKILGLPPDPYTGVQGLGFVGLLLVLNLLALRAEHHKRSIDLVTHFAGMAVGGAVGEFLYRRRRQPPPPEEEEAAAQPDAAGAATTP